MASMKMPRNARAFASAATVAAAALLALAIWRTQDRTAMPDAPRFPGAIVVSGQVVAAVGSGIAGLRVTCAGRETVTGEAGAFAIAGLWPGTLRLRVEGPGIVAAEVDAGPWIRVAVTRAVVVAGHVVA